MLNRIRIDILDAITAVRLREWEYVLPACIFRRIFTD